jgi:hypothetical protein
MVLYLQYSGVASSPLDCGFEPKEGERPVQAAQCILVKFLESGCLGMQPKSGGKLHPRLNTTRVR